MERERSPKRRGLRRWTVVVMLFVHVLLFLGNCLFVVK